MGLSSSSILKPQELTEFRKLNTSIENIEIPARPESRSVTDKKGFIIFGVGILLLIPFLIYGLVHADLRRIDHGYDNCANLCGINNSRIDDIICSGINYIGEPYSYDSYQKQCVAVCPPNTDEWLGRCTPKEVPSRRRRQIELTTDDEEINRGVQTTLEHCQKAWWKFLLNILIAIGLSIVVLFLLRYAPGVVVWGVLIFGLLVLAVATLGSWYLYFTGSKEVVGIAVVFTIVIIVIIILFIVLFKKIGLVVQLYQEASKAVAALPLMIFIPVLATLVQVIIFAVFVSTTALLITSRVLIKYADFSYEYEFNGAIIFAIVMNIIITIWAMKFIAGIQFMTISGSVAHWFFAKNKQYLESPISRSFCNVFRFHLGTIAFGSFILTLMAVIKALIRSLFKNAKMQALLECCCNNLEALLKFLSENAYIETSIHGQSFLRSGKRAAKLLLTNFASVVAINSVGDFVLGMIVLLLLFVSTGISYALFANTEYPFIPAIICLFVNAIIIGVTFGIFSTTIDTLFICFCEDSVINDGMSKPYLMSRGLMEFVENSKKVYEKKNGQ